MGRSNDNDVARWLVEMLGVPVIDYVIHACVKVVAIFTGCFRYFQVASRIVLSQFTPFFRALKGMGFSAQFKST